MLALDARVDALLAAARCATRRARCSRDTVVPRDFDAIEMPLPERGEPRLVRWEDAQAAAADRGDASRRQIAGAGNVRVQPELAEDWLAALVHRLHHSATGCRR